MIIIIITLALMPHLTMNVLVSKTNKSIAMIALSIILIIIMRTYYFIKEQLNYCHVYEQYMWWYRLINTNDKTRKFLTWSYENVTKVTKCALPTINYIMMIGLWNVILMTIAYIIAAATMQTSNEKLVNADKIKAYTPRRKRWRAIRRIMKNIGTKLEQWCNTTIDSKVNSYENRKRLQMRMKIARKHCNTHRHGKRNASMIAMVAIMAMSTRHSMPHSAQAHFDTDSKPIGIDNRCSACISHDIKDFVGTLQTCNRTIKGFGGVSHTSNIMTGTIKWKWCDDQGRVHKHIIPKSYYVPKGGARLLSPQHWAKTQSRKFNSAIGEFTNARESILQWGPEGQFTLHVPMSKATNVATFSLAPGYKNYQVFCKEAAIIGSEEDNNPLTTTSIQDDEEEKRCKTAYKPHNHKRDWYQSSSNDVPHTFDLNGPQSPKDHKHNKISNMSPAARDMLKLHYKLGHLPMQKIREMAQQGQLPRQYAKCEIPVCSACLYAKQTRRPWRGKPSSQHSKRNHELTPGEVVSVDQMVSPTPGLVAQMTGILTTKRYKYATVYVDQATRLGYTYLQKSATAEETIKGKIAFELYCLSKGINVKAYHADNGIFRANAWVNHCNANNQMLTFAGVNAHHQNGVAERRIRELQNMTRTMLIHSAQKWPKCISANLWSYAMRQANEIINNSPNMQHAQRKTPYEVFTNTKVVINIKHFQPFGCPVHVLENELQLNHPFHKWKKRSNVGIYLGMSPHHGRNVALILSRRTGLVSPQFHVKFDPLFETVEQDTYDSQWQQKAGFISKENKIENEITKSQKGVKRKHIKNVNPQQEGVERMDNPQYTQDQPRGVRSTPNPLQQQSTDKTSSVTNSRKRLKSSLNMRQTNNSLKTQYGSTAKATASGVGRNINLVHQPSPLQIMEAEISANTIHDIEGELMCLEALFPDHDKLHEEMRIESNPLLALKAVSDPDTMYLHEAMREPDWKNFQQAMQKEVDDQMKNGNFSIIKRSDVPKGKTILPAVWQMKRKRDIRTRRIKKYKARLNLDGSRQRKGIHYDQTYAPVTSWKFIRLLLILIIKCGWHSRQIDYVLAFPQAPIERELYMFIPKGFDIEGIEGCNKDYVLRVHRNVYGQCQASRVWYKYLRNKLINELKFKQSKIDECIFYRGRTVYMLYTDDSILAGPSKKEIDEIIKDLQKAKLNITDEGDIQDFLGVNIAKKADGTIHLTQPHLVDQILNDLNMSQDNVKVKSTPAMMSKLLKRDEQGVEFDKSFHYRSIIGKLNYLEKGTRSDISYITHQCARFAESPRESHAKAIRWIARYLKGTKDKGLIINPKPDVGLQVYVDADFSGNWDPKNPELDRDTARSRHGYIIMYENCPILWKSQLQTEICLSSTESEYVGLSYALREVIPIMEVMKEMKHFKLGITQTKPSIHCKVFEDNSGALEMARIHKYRPRTKHLNIKYHHFRDYVERDEISVHKIDTKDQLADYLTKPVSQEILEHLRPKVMGW